MDEYSVKIVMVSSGITHFNYEANTLCARATEQGYRFHSASPLVVLRDVDGKELYSQTFVFEKGADREKLSMKDGKQNDKN